MADKAALMGIGAAFNAAGQGFDRKFQWEMQRLRDQSLMELEREKLAIMRKSEKSQDEYRKGLLNETAATRKASERRTDMDIMNKFDANVDQMIDDALGGGAFSDVEMLMFKEYLTSDPEKAEAMLRQQGIDPNSKQWDADRVQRLAKAIQSRWQRTFPDTPLSVEQIIEEHPRLWTPPQGTNVAADGAAEAEELSHGDHLRNMGEAAGILKSEEEMEGTPESIYGQGSQGFTPLGFRPAASGAALGRGFTFEDIGQGISNLFGGFGGGGDAAEPQTGGRGLDVENVVKPPPNALPGPLLVDPETGEFLDPSRIRR